MDPARIAALLEPYHAAPLSETQLAQVSTHLDLLLRWNARTNLTSVRDPENIVTRHFGESFFLAENCVRAGAIGAAFDLGSGAGFPGIPLKILHPNLNLTLVEAHHTKAVFLREVLRAVQLEAEVKNVRAETLPDAIAELVTFRAVERFDSILAIASRLLRRSPNAPASTPTDARIPSPAVAILISTTQIRHAQEILPKWRFLPPIPVPQTQNRVIQVVEPAW